MSSSKPHFSSGLQSSIGRTSLIVLGIIVLIGIILNVVPKPEELSEEGQTTKQDPQELGEWVLPSWVHFEPKPSPFDQLDAKNIPQQDRVSWLPKQTVAILGSPLYPSGTWYPKPEFATFTPDDRWLIFGNEGFQVVDTKTFQTYFLDSLIYITGASSFGVSPCSRFFAIAGRNEANQFGIRIVDLAAKPMQILQNHCFSTKKPEHFICFTADSKSFVTYDPDVAQFHFWDTHHPTNKPVHSIQLELFPIKWKTSDDHRYLGLIYYYYPKNQTMNIDLLTRQFTNVPPPSFDESTSLDAILKDAEIRLSIKYANKFLAVSKDQKQLFTLRQVSNKPSRLQVVNKNGEIIEYSHFMNEDWNIQTQNLQRVSTKDAICILGWDGILTTHEGGRFWRIENQKFQEQTYDQPIVFNKMKNVPVSNSTINDFSQHTCYSPDGKALAVIDNSLHIKLLYRTEEGFDNQTQIPFKGALSNRGLTGFSWGPDCQTIWLQVPGGELQKWTQSEDLTWNCTYEQPIQQRLVEPRFRANNILAFMEKYHVTIWNFNGELPAKRRISFSTGEAPQIVLPTPDGKYLLVLTSDHKVRQYDLTPINPICKILFEDVSKIDLSINGSWIVIYTKQNYQIWNRESHRCIMQFSFPKEPELLQWSYDCRHAIVQHDGVVYVLRVEEK